MVKERTGTLFKRTEEEEEDRIRAIQFLHRAGKPLFSRCSRRYSQETESKAFSISSLKSKAGVLVLW